MTRDEIIQKKAELECLLLQYRTALKKEQAEFNSTGVRKRGYRDRVQFITDLQCQVTKLNSELTGIKQANRDRTRLIHAEFVELCRKELSFEFFSTLMAEAEERFALRIAGDAASDETSR